MNASTPDSSARVLDAAHYGPMRAVVSRASPTDAGRVPAVSSLRAVLDATVEAFRISSRKPPRATLRLIATDRPTDPPSAA